MGEIMQKSYHYRLAQNEDLDNATLITIINNDKFWETLSSIIVIEWSYRSAHHLALQSKFLQHSYRYLREMSSSNPGPPRRAGRRARAGLLPGLNVSSWAHTGNSRSGMSPEFILSRSSLMLKGYTPGLDAGPRDKCWA